MALFGYVLILFGSLILPYNLKRLILNQQNKWKEIIATVTGIEKTNKIVGIDMAKIMVRYEVEGAEYESSFKLPLIGSKSMSKEEMYKMIQSQYPKNGEAIIYYDEASPNSTMLEPVEYASPLTSVITGVVLLVLGIWLAFFADI